MKNFIEKSKFHFLILNKILVIFILFLNSCSSRYTITKQSLAEGNFTLFGAVLLHESDGRYGINFSSINSLILTEIDNQENDAVGSEIYANTHSLKNKPYTDIPLSGMSHSVFFAWSSLQNDKCYAITQVGYEITSQVPIGNGFYRTYTNAFNTRINPSDSFKVLKICPQKGNQFLGVLGVNEDGKIYNLIENHNILLDSAKKRIFNSTDCTFSTAEKTAKSEFFSRVVE